MKGGKWEGGILIVLTLMKNKHWETVTQTARPLVQFSKVDHVVALDTLSCLIIQVNMLGTLLTK